MVNPSLFTFDYPSVFIRKRMSSYDFWMFKLDINKVLLTLKNPVAEYCNFVMLIVIFKQFSSQNFDEVVVVIDIRI